MKNISLADELDLFTQASMEHLQFLREYAGVLLDPYPSPQAVEQLGRTAQVLTASSAQFGLPLFAQVAGKLVSIFDYAQNTGLSPESSGPIVEFIQEAAALLESDLLLLSTSGTEAIDDIQAFREKHAFAFQGADQDPEQDVEIAETECALESPTSVEETVVEETVVEEPATIVVDDTPQDVDRLPVEALPEDLEVPAEVMEFFQPEAEEHLQAMTECLLAMESNATPELVHRLFRAIHTVKGSAAQVGLQRIAHVAHRVEDLIGRLRESEVTPSAEIVDICLESIDVLKNFLYRQWSDDTAAQTAVNSLQARMACLTPTEPTEEPAVEQASQIQEEQPEVSEAVISDNAASEAVSEKPAVIVTAEPEPVAAVPAAPKEMAAASQSKSVRVPLERLDRMMNAVGSLVINRTRMLGRLGELERLTEVLNFSKARLIDKISEFQDRYEFTRLNAGSCNFGAPGTRPGLVASFSMTLPGTEPAAADFGELEWDRYDDFNILSRSLTEISADLTEVLTQLGRFVRQVDTDMDEFAKLAHHLQDEITQARMVPIGNLYTRLSRTVRDAAKATGKQVELALVGADTDLDNSIIQQISDPLIHLLRNSVAHGIEEAAERAESGKPAHGTVTLRAYNRGPQVYVEVEDDGRGIAYEKIRATVQAQGLASADAVARLTESELLEFLFRPGFSTAARKTELAGRGVGLDVVRANITSLNGEISVETEPGRGTRFTLKVPLTLIITQALFLRNGGWVFGIPLDCVEEIRRLHTSEIEEVGGKLLTRIRGQVTEVVRLDSRLGLDPVEPAIGGHYRMVVVNVGNRQVGLIVEEVLRKDEIVIKSLGEYLRNVKTFPGATIAPDGSLILLLDVSRLLAAEAVDAPASFASLPAATDDSGLAEAAPEKVILLADDSISVRRFVGRMLEKAGYKVKLACDGLEALEIATQGGCDLVLTDLEMPRTNGYELISHLRQHPVTRGVPVIVVTSRAGSKHTDKARKEGAVGFLAKPVREEQLLATVAECLNASSANRLPALMTTGASS